MDAAVLEPDHALEAKFLVEVEPGVDGVRFSALQEAVESDSMRRHAISDLQQGGTAFPDIGSWVVVTMMTKLLGLVLRQVEGSAIRSHDCAFLYSVIMVPSHSPFCSSKTIR